jgi:DnaJ-class molecular chaperone
VGQQVHQPGITLQVVAQVGRVVDDLLQVIDSGVEINTKEIQAGDLVIQNEYAVPVNE